MVLSVLISGAVRAHSGNTVCRSCR